MRSQEEHREDRMVVSEMGETWSPNMLPEMMAPSVASRLSLAGTGPSTSCGTVRGRAMGNMSTMVPHEDPDATLTKPEMSMAAGGRRWMGKEGPKAEET
eukprot:758742-Hanusia_phi.AAC.3